jgi:hypothetical protein
MLTRLFKKKGPAKLTPESVTQIMKHEAPVSREMSLMQDVGKIAPGVSAESAPSMAIPFQEARKKFAKDPGRFKLGNRAPLKKLEESAPGGPVQEGAFGEFGLKYEQQSFKSPIPQKLTQKLDAALPPTGKDVTSQAAGALTAADDIYKEVLKGKRGVAGKLWDTIWKSSGKRSDAKKFDSSKEYFAWFHEKWNREGAKGLTDKYPREVKLMIIVDDLKAMGPEAAEIESFKRIRGKVPRQLLQRRKGGYER